MKGTKPTMKSLKLIAGVCALLSLQGCFNSEIKAAKNHQERNFDRLGDVLDSRPYCADQKWTTRDAPDKSVIVTNTCLVKIDPGLFQVQEAHIRKVMDEQVVKYQNRLREGLENAQQAVVETEKKISEIDLNEPPPKGYMRDIVSSPAELLAGGKERLAKQQETLKAWQDVQQTGLARINECHDQDLKVLEARLKSVKEDRHEEIVEVTVMDNKTKLHAFDMRYGGRQSTVGPYEQSQHLFNLILPRKWDSMTTEWESRVGVQLAENLPQDCKLQSSR